jgi:hypothetical protein
MTVSLLSSPSIVVRNDTASSSSSTSSCPVSSVAAAGQLAFQPYQKEEVQVNYVSLSIYVLDSNTAREVYTEPGGIDVQSS